MKISSLIVVSAVAIAFCVNAMAEAKTTCRAPSANEKDVGTIRALEDAGAEANVHGQTLAEAQRLFAPDFISVNKDGVTKTRDDILGAYKDGRQAPWASKFTLTRIDINIYGDAATVFGSAEALPLGAPASISPLRFRYLNVWTRLDGQWRLSATQFTTF
jgi:ketosteroid isomerase-like protein